MVINCLKIRELYKYKVVFLFIMLKGWYFKSTWLCLFLFPFGVSGNAMWNWKLDFLLLPSLGKRGGSVVECRTPEREVRGSRPTSAVLCPWARHFTPRKYWLITQEAMAPSRHDWKIVDWDVKPQHNQLLTSQVFPTRKVARTFQTAREYKRCTTDTIRAFSRVLHAQVRSLFLFFVLQNKWKF